MQYLPVHGNDIQSLSLPQARSSVDCNGVLNGGQPLVCENGQTEEILFNSTHAGASSEQGATVKQVDNTNSNKMYTDNIKGHVIEDKDTTDRSASHSPSSTSLNLQENCEDTGVLLYKHDRTHNVASKSPRDCYEKASDSLVGRLRHNSKEGVLSRSRHNSKEQALVNQLLRVRHASYDGPASPEVSVNRDLLELGEFQKPISTSDNSSHSSDELKLEQDESCCTTFVSVCAVSILLLADTLNYMDRYTIAGKYI